MNQTVENIGARRLYTVMERVFEELSFTAPDRSGEAVTVDAAFVTKNLVSLDAQPILAVTCFNPSARIATTDIGGRCSTCRQFIEVGRYAKAAPDLRCDAGVSGSLH